MKEIIIGRNGNQKTPIKDLTVSRQHCKLIINDDGTLTLENLSDSGTKVDGRDIIRTTVSFNSKIQLGNSFSATLVELVGAPRPTSAPRPSAAPRPYAAAKPSTNPNHSAQQEMKSFNISYLQSVWEDFNQSNIEMANRQRKVNLTRTGLGIFTMCAMPTIFFFGPVGYALTAIGVVGNIFSFAGMKNSETAEDKQKRQDEFDDAWVCPNPNCRKTLPAKNYRMLVRNFQSCPYCKCRFTEGS